MEANVIIYLFIALTATTIGAVPMGLVNLSVLDSALKNDMRRATQIAHGASVVEVFFALASLLVGTELSPFFEGNSVVRYFVFAVLLVSGLFFWFKTNKGRIRKETQKSFGILEGVLLNILSIQVLLFWLLAATVLSAKQWLPITFPEVLLFLTGVWLAKMSVLKGYAFLAKKLASHSGKFLANSNRIIGAVLLVGSIIQFIKI